MFQAFHIGMDLQDIRIIRNVVFGNIFFQMHFFYFCQNPVLDRFFCAGLLHLIVGVFIQHLFQFSQILVGVSMGGRRVQMPDQAGGASAFRLYAFPHNGNIIRINVRQIA